MGGSGAFRLYHVDPATGLWRPAGPWLPNQLVWSFGHILAKALFVRDADYAVNTMYLEFENVAEPGNPATPPAPAESDSTAYFASLSGSASRDYLRLPITMPASLDVDPADVLSMPAGLSNRIEVSVLTAGSEGVHSKPFSSASNSVICGAALVAAPDRDDPGGDVLFARRIFEEADQIPKPSGTLQVGVRDRKTFRPV